MNVIISTDMSHDWRFLKSSVIFKIKKYLHTVMFGQSADDYLQTNG